MTAVAYPVSQRQFSQAPPARRITVVRTPASPRVSSPAVVRSRQRARARVYLRRRLAVLLVLAAVLACGWRGVALGSEPLIAPGSPAPSSQNVHVVEPGDTLWSIARSLRPTGDVRPLVDRLAALRDGRPLEVGERIVLP